MSLHSFPLSCAANGAANMRANSARDGVVRMTGLRDKGGDYYTCPVDPRDRGGIGRRASLRSWWGNPWGFESLRSHWKPLRSQAELLGTTPDSPVTIPLNLFAT